MSRDTPRRFLVEHLSDFRYQEPAQGSLMLLRLQPAEGWRAAGLLLRPRDRSCRTRTGRVRRRLRQHLPSLQHPPCARAHRRALAVRISRPRRRPICRIAWRRTPGTRWRRPQRRSIDFEFLTPSRFARPSPALDGLRRGQRAPARRRSSLLPAGDRATGCTPLSATSRAARKWIRPSSTSWRPAAASARTTPT